MKKIGIVTLYGPYVGGNVNYGFTLQAYALQHVLCDMNMDSEILAIVEKQPEDSKIVKYFKLLLKHPNVFIQKVVRKVRKVRYAKEYKGQEIRYALVNEFKLEYLKMTAEMQEDELCSIVDNYDAFISGSDQVWNPAYWMNACFLDFVPNDKPKIAYAASIGVASYTEEQSQLVQKYLPRFDAISVRERSAKVLLDSMINKDINVVLDPTLLLSKEEWDELLPKSGLNQPYLLCYLMGFNSKHREYAYKLAKEMGVTLASLSDGQIHAEDMNFGDVRIYDADSIRFIGLIKEAEAVLTDSFHGTVFSIIYRKKFYSLQRTSDTDTKSMNSRLYDLLDMLGLQSRMITEENFDRQLQITEDEIYQEADKILPEKIRESKQWLKYALEID
jgi:hypothetical protein